MTGTFSQESLDAVQAMFAEGQDNPYEGQCGQKAKREAAKQPRTPAQQQADQARAQKSKGKNTVPSAVRSEAAKKAAATRAKCRGSSPTPATPKAPTPG